jgi:7-cyano-7-deazaguanine reductase
LSGPKKGRYITLAARIEIAGFAPLFDSMRSGHPGMKKSGKNPLGETTAYPGKYAREALFAVPRREARDAMGLALPLPFHGEDIWNAWEFAWRDTDGRPLIAVLELRVPAESMNLVESKSLKLYLGSFAATSFASAGVVQDVLRSDISDCCAAPVEVALSIGANPSIATIQALPGTCIDDWPANFAADRFVPDGLRSDSGDIVSEELHTHLLRSNCPVTRQPDSGSLLIRYRGPKIHRGALLEYLVSFRHLDEFHETCVERIFRDLKLRCATESLTVYARYNRRGGIDINPFRTDCEQRAENQRLWRQ